MSIHSNIQAIFKLTSPLHCAAPEEHYVTPEGYVNPGKRPQNCSVCTATVHQRILSDGVRENIPYFPGNDLRGRLRRKAAAILMEALTAAGEKVPVELYMGLCAGAISASPDNKPLTIEEAIRGSQHVYMGLFGGGARMLRSRYSCQDMVPILKSTSQAGLIPRGLGGYGSDGDGEKPFPGNEGRIGVTDVRHILRVDDVTRVLRPQELLRFVNNATESVSSVQSGVLGNRAERKEKNKVPGKVTTKTDIGNMVTVQAIIPGTEMYFRLDMDDTLTPAQIGLVLASLEALVNEQALGGWIRTGFGKFDVTQCNLTLADEPTEVFVKVGEQYKLVPSLLEFQEQMQLAVQELNSADLLEFFTMRGNDK